jgi:competence protein ComFC
VNPPTVRWPEKLGRSVLEVLYPRTCLCCGQPLLFRASLRHSICRSCRQSLSPIKAVKRCEVCSLPLISELHRCSRCSVRDFSFTANFSLFEYRGKIRQIISQFKFSNRRSLARLIAFLLRPELESRHSGIPIVPVPGNGHSVRRRGWDPMAEVAKVLVSAGNGRMQVLSLLVRRGGGAQKGLHYGERLENIRGTIRLSAKRKGAAQSSMRVVLLDDIFTSGATVEECARVLKQGGVKEVSVLTLAIEV